MNQEIYRKTSNKQNLLPMWRTVLAFALVATDNCWNIEKYGRKQFFYEFLLRSKHVASKNWQKRNNWKNHTFLPEIHPRRHLLNKSLKKTFFLNRVGYQLFQRLLKDCFQSQPVWTESFPPVLFFFFFSSDCFPSLTF